MISSMNRPIAGNANRERRVRYQHPKGAPDADLIFGSKYVVCHLILKCVFAKGRKFVVKRRTKTPILYALYRKRHRKKR